MKNPINIYTKNDEKFVMISGFVKSVTNQDSYNSASFKIDSESKGVTDLISVMCFDNKLGINYKNLIADCTGRFVTIFAVARSHDDKVNYIARAISIAPKEYKE